MQKLLNQLLKAHFITREGSTLPELWRQAELNEQLYWAQLFSSATLQLFDGALMCALPQHDILAYNRVIGLSQLPDLANRQLQIIAKRYQELGSKRFMVQLADSPALSLLRPILETHDLKQHNLWHKLGCDLSKLEIEAPIIKNLEVKRINRDEASLFGALVAQIFDWPSDIAQLYAQTIEAPGYLHWMAFIKQQPVGLASMYCGPMAASLSIGGTLAGFEGRGIQKALIKTRLIEAKALGYQHVFTETGADTSEKPNWSYRNLLRCGFEKLYDRINFVRETAEG
ncbi:MAG: hypothetical protein ACK417_03425 [Bacteroidia bacterium]